MSKRNNKILVPEARQALDQFKGKVMAKAGYDVQGQKPNEVKYEVAEDLGISLKKGYNGNLKSSDAGKVGGKIGGNMVREMIKLARQNLE